MICPTDRTALSASLVDGIAIQGCEICAGCYVPGDLQRSLAEGAPFDVRAERLDYACPACGENMMAGSYQDFGSFIMLRCGSCEGAWLQRGHLLEMVDRRRPKTLIAGRYQLQGEFLACRYSILYNALDRSTGARVVVRKLHLPPGMADALARAQLLREGRILQRMDHRNVPRVLETVEEDGQIFLIVEDFTGVTLDEFMRDLGQGVGGDLLRRFLGQLLNVLTYLHGQEPPIVHRDLRPDSLVLTPHAQLKIADFGLARMRDSKRDASSTVFRSQGSAVYAPPEQLAGGSTRPANDIYAVGAILYFLATGVEPPDSVARYHRSVVTPSLSELRPDLDAPLVRVIEAMMEADPKVRPADVEAVEGLLREAVAPQAPREAAAEPREGTVPLGEAQLDDAMAKPSDVSGGSPADLVDDGWQAPRPPAGEPREEVTLSFEQPRTEQPAARPAEEKKSFLSGLLGFGRKKQAPRAAGAVADHLSVEQLLEKFEVVDLAKHELDREVARMLPETVARSIQGVCIGRRGTSELTVAVKDPTQVYIYDHVSYATEGRYSAHLVRCEPMQVDLALEYVYRLPQFSAALPWLEWLERKKLEAETLDVKGTKSSITFGADDVTSPIIEAVDRIVKEAISIGASDIHLETFDAETVVRYRIDGVLHEISTFEPREAGAMVKRVKIMANMDIAQDRVTQGGRISVSVGGREFDLRVSVVPVPNGESVVMRLLKKGAFDLTLKDLGFNPRDEDRYRKILSQPYGMILVSGPTGSGKSTTLYASLKEIARPDRKLLTVEDPIEYQMPRITQVQVNNAPREDEKKVTFAKALREFLRQDPDVILVGEIRDQETAAISVQAALTGHLLLSTIHTNDSIGIFARLRDMGVEPYLIASTTVGGVAQRLARKICKDCKTETPVPEPYIETFAAEGIQVDHLYRGAGCQTCHGTGYRGRMAIYEILEITPDVRELVTRMAHDDQIREAAQRNGFRTLLQDGLMKAAEGKVTLDEVQRVCMTL